ncbi:MAG: HEPN domain-containing protein [Acidobacteria bacterium]|jgi:HEPN domain-containing protein|nr:HEPN domain-containing protein [Acidobacteriota bacterium]
MSDHEHGRAILETARRDARALRGMFDAETFSDEIFGFHAQQSVEKALKAWLASLGVRFPKTHDLQQLLDLLASAHVDTAGIEAFVDLNAFAVQYRYESLYENEEALDRPELAERVDALLDRVTAALGI